MQHTIDTIGKKIIIVGISTSGKSTLARKLSEKTNIPVTFMDIIMWKPGWNYVGDEETNKKIDEISNGAEWIIEGYINKPMRSVLFERADTIIYLDPLPITSAWRYIKRWWKHKKHVRPELSGSPEKFSWKFLKLVWTKGEAISLKRYLHEVSTKEKIITLHSPKQIKVFLTSL